MSKRIIVGGTVGTTMNPQKLANKIKLDDKIESAIEKYMADNPVTVDLSNYYTKTEVDNIFNSIVDGNEVSY